MLDKRSVVALENAEFEMRIEVMREEAQEREADAVKSARETLDARIVQLVAWRVGRAVDALLN